MRRHLPQNNTRHREKVKSRNLTIRMRVRSKRKKKKKKSIYKKRENIYIKMKPIQHYTFPNPFCLERNEPDLKRAG